MAHRNHSPSEQPPARVARDGLRIWLPVVDSKFLKIANDLKTQSVDYPGILICTEKTKRELMIPLVGGHALKNACVNYPKASNVLVENIIEEIQERAPGISNGKVNIEFDGLSVKGAKSQQGQTRFILKPTIEDSRVLTTVQTEIRAAINHVTGATLEQPKHRPDLTVAFAMEPASEKDVTMLTAYYRNLLQSPQSIALGPIMFSPDPRVQ